MAQHIMVGHLTRSNFMDSVRPHLALLRQSALKYCRANESIADDIVQDTLFKAFSKLDTFKGGNFGGWLYRILHNNISSYYRKLQGSDRAASKSRRRFRTISIEQSKPSEVDDFSPLYYNDRSDFLAVEKIRNAIETLPEYMRSVFKMAVLDDLDYTQVAKKLKMPIGTVMSRIFRARKELQRKLQSMINDN